MSKLVERLKPFASCDIGDALVKLSYPLGGYLGGLSMFSPYRRGAGPSHRIVGPAVTIEMVDAKDTHSPKPSQHFADANELGKVLYIKQPSGMYSACFGGLMAKRSSVLGAAGVVIDGRFRDVKEIQDLGLPLFARDHSILGSNTFSRTKAINVPVQFHRDLWINPDDLLVADEDGVVVVPPKLVDQVAQICQERKEIDEKMLEALENGMGMGDAIKKFRK